MSEPSFVTVMVAARNEEINILKCLQSLDNQIYPKSSLQILIGDDASDDKTVLIVNEFIKSRPHFEVMRIFEPTLSVAGKTNVLIQLEKRAKGQIYLYTDADMELNPYWIAEMESQKLNGIATGVTIMSGSSFFARMQSLEWQISLFVIYLLSKMKIPITAMGNNLMIQKKAYQKIGGFESVKGSVVEDYSIFNEIVKAGFSFKQLFSVRTLGFSNPTLNFFDLMNQRKRWMVGAKKLPWYFKFANYFLALQWPLLITYWCIWGAFPLGLWAIRFVILTGIGLISIVKLRQFSLLKFLIFVDLYLAFVFLSMVIYDCFSSKIEWKGRNYEL